MPDHPQMNELADEHGMDLHYGREDKPHVHEWRMSWHEFHQVNMFVCLVETGPNTKCYAMLPDEEIERRLNATERLSAEDALYARVEVHKDNPVHDALMTYASALALKGKTPTP